MQSVCEKRLLGLTLEELKQVATSLGLPAFVGKQMADWLYRKGVQNLDAMHNLAASTREKLAQAGYEVGLRPHLEAQHSKDGTVKYLFPAAGEHFVETVYIPDGNDRATLCVSSQVGCKMHCAFCMTGRQGFQTSLSAADIVNQVYALPQHAKLTNIVFMGQGEPFDNLDAVLRAIQILTAPWGNAYSPRRITVSSVGLPKGMQHFLDACDCHLAISLHHPIPAEREKIMPAERAISIRQIVSLLEQYPAFRKKNLQPRSASLETSRQRRLSFEYIVFAGLNDTLRHADELLKLLRNLDCRVNLIRFHSIPDSPLRGVSEERMLRLRDYLTAHGLFTTIRASRGEDIFAACGLLSTAKQEGVAPSPQTHL